MTDIQAEVEQLAARVLDHWNTDIDSSCELDMPVIEGAVLVVFVADAADSGRFHLGTEVTPGVTYTQQLGMIEAARQHLSGAFRQS